MKKDKSTVGYFSFMGLRGWVLLFDTDKKRKQALKGAEGSYHRHCKGPRRQCWAQITAHEDDNFAKLASFLHGFL